MSVIRHGQRMPEPDETCAGCGEIVGTVGIAIGLNGHGSGRAAAWACSVTCAGTLAKTLIADMMALDARLGAQAEHRARLMGEAV